MSQVTAATRDTGDPPRPFRFGFTAFPTMSSREAWAETARRVQDAGYSVLTVADHFRTSGGLWSALVSAYDAAPSLRVGTLVVNSDLWNPSVVARESITTDVLTDGRFELGMGAGGNELDYRSAGVGHDPPSVRIARLRESIEIVEQALSGRVVKFQGDHYSAEADGLWPKSKQSRIPLVLGGGGRRVLELAARHADTVSIHRNLEKGTAASWKTRDGRSVRQADLVSERIAWVRAAAGQRFAAIELHSLVLRTVVTDRREAVAAELAKPLGLDPEDLLDSPHFLVGTVAQIVADLLHKRARWGFSYWTITAPADLEPFAPVIARLVGR